MVFSEEDKVLLKFCVKKGSRSEIVYQRVYEQKVVSSVICEEVAAEDWSNGTVDRKNAKMTAWNKFARLFRAKQLLRKYPECSHNSIHVVFKW